jgi:hypothetical protein
MTTLLRTTGILIMLATLPAFCFAQTDPKNVPQPPKAELNRFEPFLGKYAVTPSEYAGRTWTGTVEIKIAVKGWYIEWTNLVKTEGIDRELRMLMTWDKNANRYRIWRFSTGGIEAQNEGEVRFEGNELIMEWKGTKPDGSPAIFRNRCTMKSKDELQVITESNRRPGDANLVRVGVLTGKRLL